MWCSVCRAQTVPTEVVAGTQRCGTCGALGVETGATPAVNEVSLAQLALPRGYREEGNELVQDFGAPVRPLLLMGYILYTSALMCEGVFGVGSERFNFRYFVNAIGLVGIDIFFLYWLAVVSVNRWRIVVHDGQVNAWMGPIWLPFWRPVYAVRPDAIVVHDRGVLDARTQERWYTVDAHQGGRAYVLMYAVTDRSEAEAGRAWLASRLGLNG